MPAKSLLDLCSTLAGLSELLTITMVSRGGGSKKRTNGGHRGALHYFFACFLDKWYDHLEGQELYLCKTPSSRRGGRSGFSAASAFLSFTPTYLLVLNQTTRPNAGLTLSSTRPVDGILSSQSLCTACCEANGHSLAGMLNRSALVLASPNERLTLLWSYLQALSL